MSKGVIYVLTNPSFPEYVKIGYADDLQKRLKHLNNNECLPYAFRAYCTYEVGDRLKDKDVHHLIDKLNPDLRTTETYNGKLRKREFYSISAEDAYEILYSIAAISGTTDNLKRVLPTGEEIKEEKVAEQIQSSSKNYTEENVLLRGTSVSQDLYYFLKRILLQWEGVYIEPQKHYIAVKSSTNICDVEIQRDRLRITINLKSGHLKDPEDIAINIADKGHWGNGDYSVYFSNEDQVDAVVALIKQSYDDKL